LVHWKGLTTKGQSWEGSWHQRKMCVVNSTEENEVWYGTYIHNQETPVTVVFWTPQGIFA
jgi:hypothetical protein